MEAVMQSRTRSIIETIVNVFSGTIISYLITVFILPWWGVTVSYSDGIEISALFTAVALIRSFMVRRLFNRTPLPTIQEDTPDVWGDIVPKETLFYITRNEK
jgi:hypothetical protein